MRPWPGLAVVLLVLGVTPGRGDDGPTATPPVTQQGHDRDPSVPAAQKERNQAAWQRLVVAEELVHALTPALGRLIGSIRNLHLPGHGSRALFADSVAVTDIAPKGLAVSGAPLGPAPMVSTRTARMGPRRTEPGETLRLWKAFLDETEYVQDGKLGVLGGMFSDDERLRFDHDLKFNGHARLRTGALASINARIVLTWTRAPDSDVADPKAWRISEFETSSFKLTETRSPLFEEVLDRALPDVESRAAARESKHEHLVVKFLSGPGAFRDPYGYFTLQSHDRHPSLSVVDVDQDGYDDLYVMPEIGRNQLLVNQHDGTFRERAADYGLDVENHCSSAIFADFDNDGDPDVYIGRTLVPSMYLENRGGRFIDRSAALPRDALPALVASLSAADYDNDGLLDLYVSTYAGNMLQSLAYNPGDPRAARSDLLSEFLAPGDVKHLVALIRSGKTNAYRDLPGPPNVLVKNVGAGRFEVPPASEPLRVFRNTYQTTWADFDGDGDPDLYLANDFAPHNFFRNDGRGNFTDVTAETRTADVGFGMGASWGDYDNDGRQDLYVSNMYSKAGSRITAALPLDPTWAKMASGNSLFRNLGGTFQQVSGHTGDAVRVEIAGWSWSGQFADFNNDGHLDVFVPNGYYTAPEEFALPVDI